MKNIRKEAIIKNLHMIIDSIQKDETFLLKETYTISFSTRSEMRTTNGMQIFNDLESAVNLMRKVLTYNGDIKSVKVSMTITNNDMQNPITIESDGTNILIEAIRLKGPLQIENHIFREKNPDFKVPDFMSDIGYEVILNSTPVNTLKP